MERWKIKKNQDGFRVQLHGQVYWLNNNKRNWTRFTKTMIEKHYSFVKLFETNKHFVLWFDKDCYLTKKYSKEYKEN